MSRVAPEIKEYLLSVGFLADDDEGILFIKNYKNNNKCLLSCSPDGYFALKLQMGVGRDSFDTSLFYGYRVNDVADMKYLLTKNRFIDTVE